MRIFLFRLIFVTLYAFAATIYHNFSVDPIIFATYLIGCSAAYVIAVNLPPFLASMEERSQTMSL